MRKFDEFSKSWPGQVYGADWSWSTWSIATSAGVQAGALTSWRRALLCAKADASEGPAEDDKLVSPSEGGHICWRPNAYSSRRRDDPAPQQDRSLQHSARQFALAVAPMTSDEPPSRKLSRNSAGRPGQQPRQLGEDPQEVCSGSRTEWPRATRRAEEAPSLWLRTGEEVLRPRLAERANMPRDFLHITRSSPT